MQHIQKVTNTGGCNKYTIKYIGEIDEQNYVIAHTDSHRNGKLMSKSAFLHNTKIISFKI